MYGVVACVLFGISGCVRSRVALSVVGCLLYGAELCVVGCGSLVVARCVLCVACLRFVGCCVLIVAMRRCSLVLHVGVLVCAASVYFLLVVVGCLPSLVGVDCRCLCCVAYLLCVVCGCVLLVVS